MPLFHYRALRTSGGEIAGELVAADARDAAARLQAAGSYPIEIAAAAEARRALGRLAGRFSPAKSRHIPSRELVLFTRQLAALIGAGVPIDRALALIGDNGTRAGGRGLALDLLGAVNRGESLSAACATRAGLPPHYAMMIAAGEARGDLAAPLERLAGVLERNRATTRALVDALIYPASVLVAAALSIAFLLGFVVPRFAALLTGVQHQPPPAMRLLLTLSGAFQELALPVIIAMLVLFAGLLFRYRDREFRVALQRRMLHLPWLGPLIGKIEAERLSYLLGSLLSAGVALPGALSAARATAASDVFRAGLAGIERGVERGDGIATAFAASAILPELARELIRIGEETGDLAAMLLKASEMLRREFEATSSALVALVMPVSILALGLLIGLVAVAVLGSVIEAYDLVG